MQVDKGDSRIMKNKNKSNKRIALIIAGVVFLCLAAGGGWYYYNNKSSQTTSNSTQDSSNEPDGKPQTEAKERAAQEASQQASTNSENTINPQITSIDQDSSNLYVRAIVNGAKEGTCTLKLQKSGQSDIVKTAPIGLMTSYYACQGFNVNKSEIPSKGEWVVIVQFANSSSNGQSGDKINVN